MIRALLRKEIRENRVVLGLLWLLGGFIFLADIADESGHGTAGSYFEILRSFLLSGQLILTFIICERMVHKEYRAKTQLFLETLPLRRVDMLGVKYWFTWGQVLAMVALSLAVCAILGWENEGLTWSFLGLLSLRALAASFFWFSFFFMMSMLGRFRLGLYLVLLLITLVLDTNTGFQWLKFAPMDLLSDRFAFERDLIPWRSLGWTMVISLGFSALGWFLGLVREGSVATLLAEKMNHREKIFVTMGVLGTVFVVGSIATRNEKLPFDFPIAATAEGAGFTVKFAIFPGIDRQAAEHTANWHQDYMDELAQYLQLPALPNVFLMNRSDFDEDKFERSHLEDLAGMVLRANYTAPQFSRDRYRVWLARELLLNTSNERAGMESRRWVLDGFALDWPTMADSVGTAGLDSLYLLRAAFGVPARITARDLKQWFTFRARVGDDIADAVAWSGLKTLGRLAGEESVTAFLQAVLADPVPTDLRAVFHDWNHSVLADMARYAKVEPDAFLTAWNRDLGRVRHDCAATLAEVRIAGGTVTMTALSGRSRTLSFTPDSTITPVGQPFEFKYQVLPLLGSQADPRLVKSEVHDYQPDAVYDLPEVFQVGDRVVATFARFSPQLSCEVISGWQIRSVE